MSRPTSPRPRRSWPTAPAPSPAQFPAALLDTDTNNLAPRLGVAWRLGPRHRPARRLRHQLQQRDLFRHRTTARRRSRPSRRRNTNIGTLSTALLMENALTGVIAEETTNTYGIDKNYVLGRVETYNADVTHRSTGLGGRAPTTPTPRLEPRHRARAQPRTRRACASTACSRSCGRRPRGCRSCTRARSACSGARCAGWAAASVHAGPIARQRAVDRRRGRGSSAVVAQNDQDLDAEWALSSFDRRQRRQRRTSTTICRSARTAVAEQRRPAGVVFEGWRVTATCCSMSGTPLTARVQGAARDVAQGVNGALRADYNGRRHRARRSDRSTSSSTPARSRFRRPAVRRLGAQHHHRPRIEAAERAAVARYPAGRHARAQLQLRVEQPAEHRQLRGRRHQRQLTDVRPGPVGRPMRSAQLNLRFRF